MALSTYLIWILILLIFIDIDIGNESVGSVIPGFGSGTGDDGKGNQGGSGLEH